MLRRWLGPITAALLFLLCLLGLALWYNQTIQSGLARLISEQFKTPILRGFLVRLLLQEIAPLYLLVGLMMWVAALAWALLPVGLGWPWRNAWGGREGFLVTWGLLGTLHLILWWKVPTSLWLIPGLTGLPFWLDFLLLAPLAIGPLVWVAFRARISAGRRAFTLAGWLVVAWAGAVIPLAVGQRVPSTRATATAPNKVLAISVDGLRADTPELASLRGMHFPNAYTAIPSTRLLFSILWGGDPEHYSVGNVFPEVDEVRGEFPFTLLEKLKARGGQARFYIDDGGTIALANRTRLFDEIGMPARGWENFVNSNLSGHVPLYAAWLDLLRVFPSTHPWASMDAGLRTAIEQGRGADLVMFHSCLPHQPIFLNQAELQQIPQWWTLSPGELVPYFSLGEFKPEEIPTWDPRRDPLNFYRIRARSILAAWGPIWNALAQDPSYKDAQRVFFSDHGERFYHATETIVMGGVHGFDVDPWQIRMPFILAGPGVSEGSGPTNALSLLGFRDALGDRLLQGKLMTPESLTALPFAPVRYHTLSTESMRSSGKRYYELSTEKLLTSLLIGPDGLWAVRWDRPAAQRSREVTVARAEGDRLIVFKPLLAGGAHRLEYKGYATVADREIDAEEFQREKAKIEQVFFK